MTIEPVQNRYVATGSRIHKNCVVCSPSNKRGLGLEFVLSEDGAVEATFSCDNAFQGYANMLHGGVISALLDG
ncbi:MAG: hypothetical protein KAU28_00145, partial [Phycisphaerae bacterium]|nr:hypothetical protein [Phycisphaerae bacterium]